MTRIEKERMLFHYRNDTTTIKQEKKTKKIWIDDVQSWSEEVDDLEIEKSNNQEKIIRHSHQESIILEQHINNYVWNSTADFLADISRDQTESEDIEDAFSQFLKQE
jgi:hypothetical protein